MVTWNLSELNTLNDTDKVIKELTSKVNSLKRYKDKLNKLSSKEILEVLKKFEKISIACGKLTAYAGLKLVEKTNSSKRITYDSKISNIITNLKNELLFFSTWFKKINNKRANEIIKISGKYEYFLKSIRKNRKYALDENEERIINLKDLSGSETVSRLYDTITNSFKHNWKGKKITTSELVSKVQSSNKKQRHDAYDILLKRYEKNEVVLAEIYKSLVSDWQNENITLRKFSSPISVRNIANDIDDKTVETLLSVIKKNKQVFQRYFKIKAKVLKENKLSREDIYAPIKTKEKKYSYNLCKSIVLDA
ncbi:oligoendopeptidase F, partial [Candidatus Woesearchaeota archaeon]|nr:oligoendopeptidase F [Candidatus Woesearchaeota archaeon]